MKEITLIVNAQITVVEKVKDDDELIPLPEDERKLAVAEVIKSGLRSDNVIVHSAQIFERVVADD